MFTLYYNFGREYDEDFAYEIDSFDTKEKLEELVQRDYDIDVCELTDYIWDNFQTLCKDYEDVLKEHFYDDAREQYEESITDVYELHGVSRKDFY